ncbi:MAG: hypothetical protein ACRDZO_00560 [Egibacteraceae bacterium]
MAATPVHAKSGKASFDNVYDQADPRKYYTTLGQLDYQAPAHGARVFLRLIERQGEQFARGQPVVLDLCCSYGIIAALMNHDIELDELYARYGSAELAPLSSDELTRLDHLFYREHRRPSFTDVIGHDIATNAVAYAQRVGLHRWGSSENLETGDPSSALIQILAEVHLITVTGGVGYISERTFDRLLRYASAGRGCWVATFALRWVDYEPIANVLSRYGLKTERLAGRTFRQRRFADDAECDYVLEELDKLGIDPSGKEGDGWYHSYLYLSRPADQAHPPLDELLSGCID